ncbi:MAG: hypothetical protein IT238_07060 [Bacteroidia bacterium]|nr:hypothetical protein [Bacteroidia bacterium]MCZ2247512.1 hypothetical protein [Bacteroidia bacterium]
MMLKLSICLMIVLGIYSCSQSNKSNYSNNRDSYNYYSNEEEGDDTNFNYQYNYDISGADEEGKSIFGNIYMQGDYGSGYILDESGNETLIDVERIDEGVLSGTDENGNSYEFDVNE